MSKPTVLIVAANRTLRSELADHLATDFLVEQAADGRTCLRRLTAQPPKLILLDADLRGIDGWTTLRRIRITAPVPIILLVATAGERIRALQLGADDSLSKPVDCREVAARTDAILRRWEERMGPRTMTGRDTLAFRPDSGTVIFKGTEICLTPSEYEVLALLAAKPGQVLSRRQLLDLIWGPDTVFDLRIIDKHIMHLRRKLGDDAGAMLVNNWGIGYSFRPAPDLPPAGRSFIPC